MLSLWHIKFIIHTHAFNFEYGKKGSLIDLIEEDVFFKNLIDKN